VTMAKVGGAELLRSLRAEADRISALGKELRERIDVLTDPTAAEVEVEAVRTAPPPRTLLPARPRRSRGGAGREPSPPRPGRRRASEPLRGGGPGALARVPVGQLQQGGEPGGVLHPAG
jgi:hypothetical protein